MSGRLTPDYVPISSSALSAALRQTLVNPPDVPDFGPNALNTLSQSPATVQPRTTIAGAPLVSASMYDNYAPDIASANVAPSILEISQSASAASNVRGAASIPATAIANMRSHEGDTVTIAVKSNGEKVSYWDRLKPWERILLIGIPIGILLMLLYIWNKNRDKKKNNGGSSHCPKDGNNGESWCGDDKEKNDAKERCIRDSACSWCENDNRCICNSINVDSNAIIGSVNTVTSVEATGFRINSYGEEKKVRFREPLVDVVAPIYSGTIDDGDGVFGTELRGSIVSANIQSSASTLPTPFEVYS